MGSRGALCELRCYRLHKEAMPPHESAA